MIGTLPSSGQLPLLVDLINEQRGFFKSKSSEAEALLKVGDSQADKSLDHEETATFTTLAQALLNLDGNITLRFTRGSGYQVKARTVP